VAPIISRLKLMPILSLYHLYSVFFRHALKMIAPVHLTFAIVKMHKEDQACLLIKKHPVYNMLLKDVCALDVFIVCVFKICVLSLYHATEVISLLLHE